MNALLVSTPDRPGWLQVPEKVARKHRAPGKIFFLESMGTRLAEDEMHEIIAGLGEHPETNASRVIGGRASAFFGVDPEENGISARYVEIEPYSMRLTCQD